MYRLQWRTDVRGMKIHSGFFFSLCLACMCYNIVRFRESIDSFTRKYAARRKARQGLASNLDKVGAFPTEARRKPSELLCSFFFLPYSLSLSLFALPTIFNSPFPSPHHLHHPFLYLSPYHSLIPVNSSILGARFTLLSRPFIILARLLLSLSTTGMSKRVVKLGEK